MARRASIAGIGGATSDERSRLLAGAAAVRVATPAIPAGPADLVPQ